MNPVPTFRELQRYIRWRTKYAASLRLRGEEELRTLHADIQRQIESMSAEEVKGVPGRILTSRRSVIEDLLDAIRTPFRPSPH